MARGGYIDCFSGASGDMLLGARVDAGFSVDALRNGLCSLPVGGWSLEAETVQRHGLRGTRAKVRLDEADQPHRGLSEVLRVIHAGALPSTVTGRASTVFERLAEADALISGPP